MGHFFSLEAPELQEKLKKIKLVLLDVDGVLTNAQIFWLKDQGWTRNFNVKDGFGIHRLLESGIEVGVLTASDSEDVHQRVKHLKIPHYSFGSVNKLPGYENILKKLKLKDEEVVYIADDLFDLPVLERVGLAVTVPDAVSEVKDKVHYITKVKGGEGATREIADAILLLRGR